MIAENAKCFKTTNSYRKFAFTLAEVLVTLGIIGVVAALTLPTIVSAYRKNVVETKLKKVYSVMNQAISAAKAEHGDYTNWVKDCGGSQSPTCTSIEAKEWFDKYIGKHLNTVKIDASTGASGVKIYFPDGSILRMNNYLYDFNYYLSEDATKAPRYGINAFTFRFNPVRQHFQSPETVEHLIEKGFEPYIYNWDGTRNDLRDNQTFGCNSSSNSQAYCSKLIQYDGWHISKDYPFKF